MQETAEFKRRCEASKTILQAYAEYLPALGADVPVQMKSASTEGKHDSKVTFCHIQDHCPRDIWSQQSSALRTSPGGGSTGKLLARTSQTGI